MFQHRLREGLFGLALLAVACAPAKPDLGEAEKFAGDPGDANLADGGAANAADAANGAAPGSCTRIYSAQTNGLDLTGVWVEFYNAATISRVPMIGEKDSGSRTLYLHQWTQTGLDVAGSFEICEMDIRPYGGTTNEVNPDLFAAMPRTPMIIELSADAPGAAFAPSDWIQTWGVKLDDPAHDDLPATPDDPRVWDQDGDGFPGVTIYVEGILTGEIYVVQRSFSHHLGTVQSADEIRGLIREESKQIMVDASSAALIQDVETKPNPDPLKSYFIMLRVNGDCTCLGLGGVAREWFDYSD